MRSGGFGRKLSQRCFSQHPHVRYPKSNGCTMQNLPETITLRIFLTSSEARGKGMLKMSKWVQTTNEFHLEFKSLLRSSAKLVHLSTAELSTSSMAQALHCSLVWKRRFRKNSSDQTAIGKILPGHMSLDAVISLGMLGGSLSLLA